MIKRMTKSFIVYMNEQFKVLFAQCRKSGKFAKLSKAKEELAELDKYSTMSVLFACVLSLFTGILFAGDVCSMEQIVLIDIVGVIAFLSTLMLSYYKDFLA